MTTNTSMSTGIKKPITAITQRKTIERFILSYFINSYSLAIKKFSFVLVSSGRKKMHKKPIQFSYVKKSFLLTRKELDNSGQQGADSSVTLLKYRSRSVCCWSRRLRHKLKHSQTQFPAFPSFRKNDEHDRRYAVSV